MASPRICAVEGCSKPAHARGWCSAHHNRWCRHGNPLGGGSPRDGRDKYPLLNTWKKMAARCSNERCPGFRHYGGRGITVCERWRNDFWAFVEDMGPRPSPKHSVDRWPDPAGNYEPGNVRWVTEIAKFVGTTQAIVKQPNDGGNPACSSARRGLRPGRATGSRSGRTRGLYSSTLRCMMNGKARFGLSKGITFYAGEPKASRRCPYIVTSR